LNSSRPSLLRRLFAPVIRRGSDLARDDQGVTVVEFALLAPIFFTMIFAILETAMVFFASQVLDSAVEDASRKIRTGEAQTAGFQMTDFRSLLCDSTFGLFDCAQIRLNVRNIGSFAAANEPVVQNCTEIACSWTLEELFLPGVGREVVQVRAFYRWPLVITLPYFNLKNQPDNYRLIAGTRVFRNEPFLLSSGEDD
jgi:Flp pilus assembly protein TadG